MALCKVNILASSGCTTCTVIILYFRSVLNIYFPLLQKLWIPLIKFMMEPTTSEYLIIFPYNEAQLNYV
jgi:hypothetical protein